MYDAEFVSNWASILKSVEKLCYKVKNGFKLSWLNFPTNILTVKLSYKHPDSSLYVGGFS